MARGKQTCKILKEIRKQIAAENDIKLVIEECTYQGDCLGTCPKCEAEVRYLERELERRQRMGKAAIFAGMTIGTAITAAGCGPLAPTPNGMMENPRDTIVASDTIRNDSVEEPILLEGDVLAPEPDTMKAEKKKATCKNEEPLAIPGDVVVFEEIEGEMPEIFPEVGEVEGESDVYQIVEQMPEFPGGVAELFHYISKNIHYPQKAREKGIQGRVFIGFIVEKDGSISNVRNLRGVDSELDAEAIRVVKSMPKWKPGKHKGEFVRVSYQIPILFKLEDQQD
ncbi:MAG: energy transducer TonB [Bacteroidales bacterium]|nr:energy transducer TonB [Bacteroidales bacterium]